MALDRRGRFGSDHYEQTGHKDAFGCSGRVHPYSGMRHGAGNFTRAAANAFFSIALDKRAESFRFHSSCSIAGFLCFRNITIRPDFMRK
jgi:hypothetical protein